MNIYIDNVKYEYELNNIALQFSKCICRFYITTDTSEVFDTIDQDYIVIHSIKPENMVVCYGKIEEHNITYKEFPIATEKDLKNCYKRILYKVLSSVTDTTLDWGILTGIRPTKIYRELNNFFSDKNKVEQLFSQSTLVSGKKAQILGQINSVEQTIIESINPNDFSIYISVPFCPTKCNYCTFFSNEIAKKSHLVQIYLDTLSYELSKVLQHDWSKKRNITSLYIGGGTPSVLDHQNLLRFLQIISEHIELSKVKEITFEAGRPDTIDIDKLNLIRSFGINRISINPQTMVDETLKKIGRMHSSDEIINAYYNARKVGFSNINMDLIIGLDNEQFSDIQYSIQKVLELAPDSITIHSLALKKASDLTKTVSKELIADRSSIVSGIMDYIYTELSAGYIPYYLYRQKNILGGQENVGFSKIGKESIYNILIIEEYQNILSFGPGGVSRFVYPKENRIERISNTKNLEEYIRSIDVYIDKKFQEMMLYADY